MKIALKFQSHAEPSIELQAETDKEKAILAFLAEGTGRRWKADPWYAYRQGAVGRLELVVEPQQEVGNVSG